MKPWKRRPVRGFTLLEMLVVMVLLGFVTSLALPAMQRWHDATQLRSRTAVIVDALRVAALKAAASRRTWVMDAQSFQPAPVASAALAAPSGERPPTGAGTGAAPALAQAPAVPLHGHVRVELPPGWSAERVEEARFLANGLCVPGVAVLTTERGERVVVHIRGPLCAVDQSRGSAT